MKALSIRQPWAWLIAHGYKPVENRTWKTNYRGPILLHASQGMTRFEYEEAAAVAIDAGVTNLPAFESLERGGFVGAVDVVDCVESHQSPFFFGPYGFQLANAKPIPFVPFKGKLGFFEVTDEQVPT